MNVLITGTSRGIGLALTKQALEVGHTVIAVARNTRAGELAALAGKAQKGKLILLDGDVAEPTSLEAAVKAVSALASLDILINNAGIMCKAVTAETFEESFMVNSIAPFLWFQALKSYLEKSPQPKVAMISTKMGSIADNTSGAYYTYRSSKAALNMITKSLTIDNPKIAFALIHPGWVKTDMGGDEAPVGPAESAKGIWSVIDRWRKDDSGRFVDFQGQSLAW